jgi:Leucine-rich repeat (LRR) protein
MKGKKTLKRNKKNQFRRTKKTTLKRPIKMQKGGTFNIEEYLNSLPDDIEGINVSGKGLTYLPDLSRFKKLKRLFCHNNNLTRLPELTNNLNSLNCANNKLTVLPELNENLQILFCYDNNLTILPELNHKLREINCSKNDITSLPELTNNLKGLNCSNNKLTRLPELNEELKYLFCSNNELISLPKLNEKLEYLYCNYNKLTRLPELNDNLKLLNCSNNKLTSLPELNDNLQNLSCYNNDLPDIVMNIGIITEEKRNIINKLANYRDKIIHSKYKTKLRDFYYKKVVEPKEMAKFHPDNIQNILETLGEDHKDEDYDEAIKELGKMKIKK